MFLGMESTGCFWNFGVRSQWRNSTGLWSRFDTWDLHGLATWPGSTDAVRMWFLQHASRSNLVVNPQELVLLQVWRAGPKCTSCFLCGLRTEIYTSHAISWGTLHICQEQSKKRLGSSQSPHSVEFERLRNLQELSETNCGRRCVLNLPCSTVIKESWTKIFITQWPRFSAMAMGTLVWFHDFAGPVGCWLTGRNDGFPEP